ncbi:hypothetical protein D3C72_2111940 [compost metagenome]
MFQNVRADDIVVLAQQESLCKIDLFQIRHSDIAIMGPGQFGLFSAEGHAVDGAAQTLVQVLAQHTRAAAQIEHT